MASFKANLTTLELLSLIHLACVYSVQCRTQKIFMGGFVQWHSKQYVKTIKLLCAGNKVF